MAPAEPCKNEHRSCYKQAAPLEQKIIFISSSQNGQAHYSYFVNFAPEEQPVYRNNLVKATGSSGATYSSR